MPWCLDALLRLFSLRHSAGVRAYTYTSNRETKSETMDNRKDRRPALRRCRRGRLRCPSRGIRRRLEAACMRSGPTGVFLRRFGARRIVLGPELEPLSFPSRRQLLTAARSKRSARPRPGTIERKVGWTLEKGAMFFFFFFLLKKIPFCLLLQ